MRIGIDGRAISHPQAGGYKSYVTTLLESLANADKENSYIVYLDGDIPPDLLLNNRNFQLQIVPTRVPGRWWREQVVLPRRLARDRVTGAHFPTNTGPLLCRCPYVLTILDAMRFLDMPQLPRPYSPRTIFELLSLLYMRYFTARAARRAGCIITISQCSKRDIVNRLSIRPDTVRVIYPAPRSLYRPVDDNRLLDACRKTYELGEQFMLAFGSTAPRKNTQAVVEAYAHLGRDILSKYRLVLIASSPSAKDQLGRLVKRCGIEQRVTLLTGVPDSDLSLLYNAAEAFIFPSLYEGFGLPALEAMTCGTPVIASNVSSLPEVVGDAAVLVDPQDEVALSRAISDVLTHDGLRTQLARSGLARASLFNGQRQALDTLAVYRAVGSP